MPAPRAHRRRQYVIQSGLQWQYLSVMLLWIALTTTLVGASLYIGIWSEVIPEFSQARMAEKMDLARQLSDYEEVRSGAVPHPGLRLFREAQMLSAPGVRSSPRLIPRCFWLGPYLRGSISAAPTSSGSRASYTSGWTGPG